MSLVMRCDAPAIDECNRTLGLEYEYQWIKVEFPNQSGMPMTMHFCCFKHAQRRLAALDWD